MHKHRYRTRSFEPPPEYNSLEMEAALCVWEWINDVTLKPEVNPMAQTNWTKYREDVGSATVRHESMEYGRVCLAVYDSIKEVDPDLFDGFAYDFEVIPTIMSFIEPGRVPDLKEAAKINLQVFAEFAERKAEWTARAKANG